MEIKSDSEMIMHMGPQHAMVPGPFLLDVLVEGERVKKAFLDMGYIHKGIEKIMENRTWLQGITYTDRMCYVASSLQQRVLLWSGGEDLGPGGSAEGAIYPRHPGGAFQNSEPPHRHRRVPDTLSQASDMPPGST